MIENCFHCGLPVPRDVQLSVKYREVDQPTCCAGCQAVAATIIQSGLSDYYQHRTGAARQATQLPIELLEQSNLYDSEEVQRSFVRFESVNLREASLLLDGITCSACIWLNEQHLLKLPGILSVEINYSSHRARVRWDNTRVQLSSILEAVRTIGYRAYPYGAERQEVLNQLERKQAISRLWVAGLSMMQVMMYAGPIYLAPDGEISPHFLWLLHWASCLLTVPVVLYSAWPFYIGTWRDLRIRRVGMDAPVTIGILAAFLSSLWALINQIEQGIYFDSVSMFVFLLLGGRYLEGIARRKAGDATERLLKRIPVFAHHLAGWPTSRDSIEIAVAQLRPGEVVLIKPGEIIPVDGVVLDGCSASNEALLTGESRPVTKDPGARVIAGSFNIVSPLLVRVEQIGPGTRLEGIVRLMDQTLSEKPRIALLADRFASWFVALLLLVAICTYVSWFNVEPGRALWIMVAVLVISCPCALSLATPAALIAASSHLAALGVLTTRGNALETLPKISDVVFDKTGTLTHGDMQLLDCWTALGRDPAMVLNTAAALERGSEHPVASALITAACNGPQQIAERIFNHPGQGVSGQLDGRTWWIGSPEFIASKVGSCPLPALDWHENRTLIALADDSALVALFVLGEGVRADAALLLRKLKQRGLCVHLLSGDSAGSVASLAKQLGMDAYMARASPEDKVAYIAGLQAAGKRVLMVGDGINDAPVLVKADVSIGMGGGADVTRASVDMILIGDELGPIYDAFELARRTLSVIRQNLCWAAAYNIVALPLAITGYVTPGLASLGMASSSLIVVGNALRLVKR